MRFWSTGGFPERKLNNRKMEAVMKAEAKGLVRVERVIKNRRIIRIGKNHKARRKIENLYRAHKLHEF